MTIENLRTICLKFRGITEDIKWEHHLCFNVGGKMFLIPSPDEVPVSASFKADDDEFDSLSAKPGFKPAAYLAKHKWIYASDIKLLGKKQWEHYIKRSYELIATKLPAKQKKLLGIIN